MSRLRNSLGPAVIHAEPGRIVLPGGQVITKGKWGVPLDKNDTLPLAIKHSHERAVIAIRGDFGNLSIGGGDPNHASTAWQGPGAPVNVAIVAEPDMPQSPSINGLSLRDNLGGFDLVTTCGVTLRCPSGSASAVICYAGVNSGRVRLWEGIVEPENEIAWNGHGSKWPIRMNGHLNGGDGPLEAWTSYTGQNVKHVGNAKGGGLELIDFEIWPGQEWGFLYGDNFGPRSRIVGIRRHRRAPVSLRCERGLIQVVNRSAANDPVSKGGPSGYGPLEIADIETSLCGSDPSMPGQGSAITIAGHLGPVHIHDLALRGYNGGGIVVWTAAAPIHGAWTFTDGFSTGHVRIENVDLESDTNDNPHIAVSGARSLYLGPSRIVGPKVALDVSNSFGGPIDCGPVSLGMNATHPGWQAQGGRVRIKSKMLTAAQIDVLVREEIDPTSM